MVNIAVETKTYNDVIHALNRAWINGNELQICIDSKESLLSLESTYGKISHIAGHESGDICISFGGAMATIKNCSHVTLEKMYVDDEDGGYFDGYSLIYDEKEIIVFISIAHFSDLD